MTAGIRGADGRRERSASWRCRAMAGACAATREEEHGGEGDEKSAPTSHALGAVVHCFDAVQATGGRCESVRHGGHVPPVPEIAGEDCNASRVGVTEPDIEMTDEVIVRIVVLNGKHRAN